MTANIEIPTSDGAGRIPAYVARPSGTPRGAIIVIQEIFGVNPGIVKKADDWAAKGYLAVAPDVFWRQEPGVSLDSDIQEEFQKAIQLMMGHDFDQGLDDLKAVLAWIRKELPGTKTGLVGFCMGGKIAYQMATRSDIEASVGYYGVGLHQMLEEAGNISGRLMLHIPTADGFVPPDQQAAIHAALDAHPRVTLHDYAGLDHGFADTFSSRRNEEGATLADRRTEEFFNKWVG